MKEAADDEERRYLEEEWNREYLKDADEVPEPDDADNTSAIEVDYPNNSY